MESMDPMYCYALCIVCQSLFQQNWHFGIILCSFDCLSTIGLEKGLNFVLASHKLFERLLYVCALGMNAQVM